MHLQDLYTTEHLNYHWVIEAVQNQQIHMSCMNFEVFDQDYLNNGLLDILHMLIISRLLL